MVNPNVFFFTLGMGIVFFVTSGFIFRRDVSSETEDGENLDAYSINDYKSLAEKQRNCWQKVSRNNGFYLWALIVSYAAQKIGQFSGHPLFGSDLVIAMTYLIAFSSSLKRLVRDRVSDSQVISTMLTGLQLEKAYPELGKDYFQSSLKDYRGLGMFSIAFFRVILPIALLFLAVDFGFLSRISSDLSQWENVTISVGILGLTASIFWKIGCQPYYALRKKSKEMIT